MKKTILISSHILPELAELCNKVAIIEAGKLIMAGSVTEISAQLEGGVRLGIRVASRPEECCQFLSERPEIARANLVDGSIDALYRGDPEHQYTVLTALVQAGFEVQSFTEREMDLEDLYMRVTRGVVS